MEDIDSNFESKQLIRNRAIALVDGLNLYHALKSEPEFAFPYRKYKWIDLQKLVSHFLRPLDDLIETYNFTCVCTWDKEKAERHRKYIYALKNSGVKVREGKFKPVTKTCRGHCKMNYGTHEEKRTDVSIAISLFSLAYQDVFDNAYLITADTDQIPAIQETRKHFPYKNIFLILPINGKTDELSSVCTSTFEIKEQHLKTSMFDWELSSKATGRIITCPNIWRKEFEEKENKSVSLK
jgi:uncharacterized LabA/DUF88 family protein